MYLSYIWILWYPVMLKSRCAAWQKTILKASCGAGTVGTALLSCWGESLCCSKCMSQARNWNDTLLGKDIVAHGSCSKDG